MFFQIPFQKIFYCCSNTVIPVFPLLLSLVLPTQSLPLSILPPLSLSMDPLYMFLDLTLPFLSLLIPLSPPLWPLSVCSLFPCLWFYFARLFVLLVRFHLQVRSYGIYLCFSTWLISLSIIFFSSIHAVVKGKEFLLSFCCIVFHCVNVPLSFDPLIY